MSVIVRDRLYSAVCSSVLRVVVLHRCPYSNTMMHDAHRLTLRHRARPKHTISCFNAMQGLCCKQSSRFLLHPSASTPAVYRQHQASPPVPQMQRPKHWIEISGIICLHPSLQHSKPNPPLPLHCLHHMLLALRRHSFKRPYLNLTGKAWWGMYSPK